MASLNLGFPNDDLYWMVTWVERVAFIENDFVFKLHLVSINISAFNQSFYKAANYNYDFITRYIDTESFAIHAEIGSIWHRKALIFSPSRHHKIHSGFITHTITLRQPAYASCQPLSEIVDCTENLTGFHPFPVPRQEPFPHRLGQSNCLIVDSPHFLFKDRYNTAFLLFPPSELLRFYHCGSSPYLFRQLLRNGLTEDRIYKRRATRYNTATQELFVQLRKQVPDEDALLVGRLAGDRAAYEAARSIGQNIQHQLLNTCSARLLTTFPFQGPTTLQVVGKLFKTLDRDKKWAFFVYAIISCSSSFPFRQLLYSRDNDSRVRMANPSADAPRPRHSSGSASLKEELAATASPISGQADNHTVATEELVPRFTQAPPFARLPKDQRPILVPGKIPQWYSVPARNAVLPIPLDIPAEDINPDCLIPRPTPEKAPSLAFNEFHTIITGLTQLGLTCYCLTYWSGWARSKQYKDFYLPRYRNLSAKERRWLSVVTGFVTDKQISERKRKLRKRRKAVVLEVVYGHATFYLLECESGLNESFSRMLIWYDPPDDLPDELNTLFPLLVGKRGIWREFPFPTYATTRPLHHVAGETGLSVARRVFSYIKQILNLYNSTPTASAHPERFRNSIY